MRRTARVLFATALAGAVVGGTASTAFADPAAEVSPRTVAPGGTVTVSVSCDTAGGTPPEYIDATSQGFEDGKVRLHRVAGTDDSAAGAAYSGTARIPAAGSADRSDGAGNDSNDGRSTAETGAGDTGASGDGAAVPGAVEPSDAGGADSVGPDSVGPDSVGPDSVETDAAVPDSLGADGGGHGDVGPDAVGADGEWDVDGACPGGAGGKEKQWSASYSVSRDGTGSHETANPGHDTGEHPVVGAQRGVHAGEGGTFTDSLPALITGSVLIAGAVGAAVYRLRHRRSSVDG
ncbi:hypothetical protein ACFVYF_18330 [Streptomyces sp. NPDC058274]|uniref:hypothetical protein n=1 Tax=Streptomyces sp. NPDC058274 TaxID=3346416 RepID=UPI0036EB4476